MGLCFNRNRSIGTISILTGNICTMIGVKVVLMRFKRDGNVGNLRMSELVLMQGMMWEFLNFVKLILIERAWVCMRMMRCV